MKSSSLELSDVLDKANRLRERLPPLADTDPFTERTVYYYVQQGLLPRASRRRGPGTTYPDDFVDRLLVIRRLQKEHSLTLAEIRQVMHEVRPRDLRAAARGKKPLKIVLPGRGDDLASGAARTFQDFGLDPPASARMSRPAPSSDVRSRKREEGKTLFRVARSRDGKTSRHSEDLFIAESSSEFAPQDIGIGPDATLSIRKALTPLQARRVKQVVGLLRSILEEED